MFYYWLFEIQVQVTNVIFWLHLSLYSTIAIQITILAPQTCARRRVSPKSDDNRHSICINNVHCRIWGRCPKDRGGHSLSLSERAVQRQAG